MLFEIRDPTRRITLVGDDMIVFFADFLPSDFDGVAVFFHHFKGEPLTTQHQCNDQSSLEAVKRTTSG